AMARRRRSHGRLSLLSARARAHRPLQPEMKVIVSFRNPVERAFSQWNMRREKGQEPLEFIDALKRDEEIGIWKGPRGNAYLARSLYVPQLEKVFQLFPRGRVFIIKYEN